MVKTTVPAINGGKNLRIFLIVSPTRIAQMPPRLGTQDCGDTALISNGLHTWHIGKLTPMITGVRRLNESQFSFQSEELQESGKCRYN